MADYTQHLRLFHRSLILHNRISYPDAKSHPETGTCFRALNSKSFDSIKISHRRGQLPKHRTKPNEVLFIIRGIVAFHVASGFVPSHPFRASRSSEMESDQGGRPPIGSDRVGGLIRQYHQPRIHQGQHRMTLDEYK